MSSPLTSGKEDYKNITGCIKAYAVLYYLLYTEITQKLKGIWIVKRD